MPDTLPVDVDVPARLRALIAAKGHSLADVAEAAGLHRQAVSRTLGGRQVSPTVATVARILTAIDATWGDLDGA